jgi:hypothetical protein
MAQIPLRNLMVMPGRLDLLSILQLTGQPGRGVDQSRETFGTDIDLLPQVLQAHEWNLLFSFITIQTGFHDFHSWI